MIVGTSVPTTMVGTAAPTIIVWTTVPTMIAGTKISSMAVPTTFVGPVVPTNVVGTTVHIDSLKIGQVNFKVFWKEINKEIPLGEICPPSLNDTIKMCLL